MGWFIYFLGWFIWIIGYYIFKIYIDKDIWTKKKLIIYRGFISGFVSWFGIICVLSVLITYGIIELNDWIEDKLNK